MFTKEKRSDIMRSIKSKNTGLEADTEKILKKNHIRYTLHPEMFGSPDFLLEGRILLFCDSSFWHGRNWEALGKRLAAGSNPDYWVKHIDSNRKRDVVVNQTLRERGHAVLRLWDTDIRKRPEWCVAKIAEALDGQGTPTETANVKSCASGGVARDG